MSFDCLLTNNPFSKSSNALVPKSSISGTLGLNTHDKNKLAPKLTKGFLKKLNSFVPLALVTTLVTVSTTPPIRYETPFCIF